MRVVASVGEMHSERRGAREPVGLVPTMGALHEGHLSLVRRARADNALCVVSIFVNPLQFGPQEDLGTYPRDLAGDLALLQREGVDLVLTPEAAEMYPEGFQTYVEVEGLTRRLEGASRPGHFRGVTTVVAKLFCIVRPQRAYFGQKDAQQALVVRRMAADLGLDIEVAVLPTVREADGLALSSRNRYLSAEERRAALSLWLGLSRALEAWRAGERRAERLRQLARNTIEAEPLARLDYVSLASPQTLEEATEAEQGHLLLVAAHVGGTRLIDNVVLE